MRIYTIGHSTRSLDELVALLRASGVTRLADIRRYPGSRRYPHFSRESLALEMPKRGIEYVHIPELGGRRKALPDSKNDALRNEQFRAYADYMGTDEFKEAVDRLVAICHPERSEGPGGTGGAQTLPPRSLATLGMTTVAIMCAEAVPWRCHRSFVADELVRRGIEVVHILGANDRRRHELNPLAREAGGRLIYNRG